MSKKVWTNLAGTALIVASMVVAGCGGTQQSNARSAPRNVAGSGLIPLAAYLPFSADDVATLWTAFGAKFSACSTASGGPRVVVRIPSAAKQIYYRPYQEAGRWGTDDVARARQSGLWQMREIPSNALSDTAGPIRAVDPSRQSEVDQMMGDSQGCWTKTIRTVGWDPSDHLDGRILDLASRAHVSAENQGAAKLASWSVCMTKSGFPGRTLSDGSDKFDFSAPATADEKADAVAEATCNKRGRIAETLSAADDDFENKFMARYQAELTNTYQRGRARLAQAKSIIARSNQ